MTTLGDHIEDFKRSFPLGLQVAVPLEYKPVRLDDGNVTTAELRYFDVSELVQRLINEIKKDDKFFGELKCIMNRV